MDMIDSIKSYFCLLKIILAISELQFFAREQISFEGMVCKRIIFRYLNCRKHLNLIRLKLTPLFFRNCAHQGSFLTPSIDLIIHRISALGGIPQNRHPIL